MVHLGPLRSNSGNRNHRTPVTPVPKIKKLVDPSSYHSPEGIHKSLPESQNDPNPRLLQHSKTVESRLLQSHKKSKSLILGRFPCQDLSGQHMDGQTTGRPKKDPPSLPDASDPVAINKGLLDHLFAPKDPLPSRGPLKGYPSATPLTEEETRLALSKSSPSSAPGPDGIPYSVRKRVNLINPAILLELLSSLVGFGDHTPSLKTANGLVLDKPGKVSYDSPASFRILILLKTISKILEGVMTV